MKLLWFLAFIGALHLCTGANILVVVPMPSRSHCILFDRLSSELAKKGHQVTLITTYPNPKPVKNLKQVVLPNLHPELMKFMGQNQKEGQNMFEMRHMNKWIMSLLMPRMGSYLMDVVLSTDVIQDFIKSDQKFDVIIGEVFIDESMIAGLSHKFKAPIIGLAPFMANLWANYLVGNPAPASYIPDPLLGYGTDMTLCQRIENTVFTLIQELNYELSYLPSQDAVMRKYFGNDLPPLAEILRNTSLVLVNHHYSLGFPKPYLPNMIEVGGYHVPPPKPLPEDLQKYMDGAKHGVILFSMGSNLRSAELPKETRDGILKAFSRLKQNVIWKFEDEKIPDLPKNVKVSKWLPQSDILAHPNLKLFITHGGLLSTTESVLRGKPMVGIPIFGDQPMNMRYVENSGFGRYLDFDDISEEVLYKTITEVLENPKYTENVQKGSALLQDTPLTAIETAIYWIEYVARHKGAPHLKSAAQDLKWYQLYLIDVIGFLVVAGGVSVLISVKVTKFVGCRVLRLFCKKCKKTSAEKKKN